MISRSDLLRKPGFRVGAVLALVVVAMALVGPALTGPPNTPDYANQLDPPGRAHWLGTDQAGRDQLARTATGARTSLAAAAAVCTLTTVVGLAVGGAAGYWGGLVDRVLGRVIDVLLGVPALIVALAIVGAVGVGSANLVLAMVATGWAYPARVARSVVLGSHARLDVIAARLAGVGRARIFTTHVLAGTLATVLVAATATIGETVLTLAGLSFLGLGAQPPTAELGQMLAETQRALMSSPWLLVGPGAVIVLTVCAAMLISDALRDALDPRASWPAARSARLPRRPTVGPTPVTVEAGDVPSLRIRDLVVAYAGGARAVRGVSVSIHPGECLALVGESGCGKSTLARSVLRLNPPSAVVDGTVHVGALDVLSLPPSGLRRARGMAIGYVAQDPFAACDPLRSVRSHVEEAWRAHGLRPPAGEPTRRVAALGVERAEARMAERPHCWSGGMLQRATIAAASAHQPTLIVADEPTSALDAELADDVLYTLREASRALLLVSHDLRLVARHSDRVAVMYAGRIVETGPTLDVVARPRHPYTRALLAASPEPGRDAAVALPGAPPIFAGAVEPAGCPFAVRCPDAIDGCQDVEPDLVGGVACWNGDR
ncbi:MAG: dipeptide/oligopeptide/nickel ABC transporter permease/ATP-binding protein [Acidimicrobiales bacterium]